MNLRPPRPDITYISRRIKRPPIAVETNQINTEPRRSRDQASPLTTLMFQARSSETGLTLRRTPTAASTSESVDHINGSPGTLNLERRSDGRPPRRGTAVKPEQSMPGSVSSSLFQAPDFGSVRHLSEENPIMRLNARQAGIGSLLISGARSTAWEDINLTTGAENAHGHKAGTAVGTRGNRPLVTFHEGFAVVALRHIQQLRRAIFIAEATPLTVSIFGGAAVAIPPRNSNAEKAILYISRTGELLELRAEYVADADDPTVWAEFGFRMTLPVNPHRVSR